MPLQCKQIEHNPKQFQVCNPIASKSGWWALWAEGNWTLKGPGKYLTSAMFSSGWAAERNEEGRKAGGDKVHTRRLISYAKYCPPLWALIPTGIWPCLLFVWYFPSYILFYTFLSNLHYLSFAHTLNLLQLHWDSWLPPTHQRTGKQLAFWTYFLLSSWWEDDFLLLDKIQLVLNLELKHKTYFKSITEVLRDHRQRQ